MSFFGELLHRPSRRDLEQGLAVARIRQHGAELRRGAALGIAGRNLAMLISAEEQRDAALERVALLEMQLGEARAALEVDPATGLHSKQWLVDRWAALDPRPTGLLLLDLDGFKGVNDRYGHGGGDEVIRVVAGRLPVHDGHVPARLTRGDEFVLVLTGGQELVPTAAMVGGLVAAPIQLAGERPVVVTASIGVTGVAGGEPLDDVLRRADVAMYHAKRNGGRPVLWQPGMTMPPPAAGCKRAGGVR